VELARSLKVTRGRKLRVDSMVVQTNIHHPTDSALLADGVRLISRLLRAAKKVLPTEVASQLANKEAFRTPNRSVRRVAQSGCTGSQGAKQRKLVRSSKRLTRS
jgi:IS5 family transposase